MYITLSHLTAYTVHSDRFYDYITRSKSDVYIVVFFEVLKQI